MKKIQEQTILQFEAFLKNFTKKNGKKLGERTISGMLILAKFIEEAEQNESLEGLTKKYETYVKARSYPIAMYSLWLYLKFLGYSDKFVKDLVSFKRRNITAITDEEKLAESVLSKKEVVFLTQNIPNLRDRLLVMLLYDTGSRISEILNLKLKDVDLETKEIQVMGKGRKPRTVYFHNQTLELLKVYINDQKILSPNFPLFTIKPCTVWFNFKKYGKELLNRELHPHMLRHSRLQHMADEGIDSFSIKSYAGHADIGTTQIYVKASKFQGKIAFDKAGDLWEKK